jgi:dihydroorotase
MPSILIQNGTILDPSRKLQKKGDLLIIDGKIATGTSFKAERTIDASGCYVTPGLIDFICREGERVGLCNVHPIGAITKGR